MKNSRFVYSLSFIAIMFCSVLSFVPANENPTARNVVKKANDTTLDVDLSKTYAQIGSHDGVDKLRFVTAIDMSNENVEKVNYTRIADFATTTTVEKEVTSLYKSVAGSEDTVYYYDGTELVNSNPENGYYFASYVVAYKSSTNKANLFTVAMDVNDNAAKAPFLTTSYNAIAASEANAVASFVVDGELVGRCIVEQGNAPVYYLGTEEGQYWSDGVNYFEELPTITTDTEFTLVSFADVQADAKTTIAGYQLVAGEYTEANLAEYNSVISKAQASVDAATTLDDVNYIVKNAKYDVERLPELFSYTPISTVEEWTTLIKANPSGNFKLMNDIDLEGGWIAGNYNLQIVNGFSGILDGQGYAIKNSKHDGGWNQPTLFGDNSGTIKNVAFLNYNGPTVTMTNTAIVSHNYGTMENIYVEFVARADNGKIYGKRNAVLAGYSDSGTIRNCIVNIRLANSTIQDGLQFGNDTGFGSIVGEANKFAGHLYNSHAIINDTNIKDIASYDVTPNGDVIKQFKKEGSAQHKSYYHMYKNAQTSMATFDSTMWKFTEKGIKFGKSVNYVDDYTYITNANEFKTAFLANPSGKFRLANDIDLAGSFVSNEWEENNVKISYLAKEFSGIFDGMGYKICNGWMRDGWNQNSLFKINNGLIMNIEFDNIYGGMKNTNTALISENNGTIKNLYVNWLIKSDNSRYGDGTGGVIANYSSTGTIKNCIVNLGLHELEAAPSWYGSIIGNANNWNGKLLNCHAIVNGTGVNDIAAVDGDPTDPNGGVIGSFKRSGSAQHNTYADLYANADVSMYHGNIWSFTETGITFFGRQVLTYTAPEVTA